MISEIISTELTKFDEVVPAVNELAKKFLPLKISSVDDKEGYAEVAKALRFIVSKRTAVEEKRKELKADSLTFGRAVDSRAKEITAMLEPIESHLKNEKARIDEEKEKIAKAIEQERQENINARIRSLMEIPNLWQTQTEFVWVSKITGEEFSILKINVEVFTDEDFNEFVNRVKTIALAENDELIKIEAEKKAEAERIELEKKKLEEEKALMEREMNQMKADRAKVRIAQLEELGLHCRTNSVYFKKDLKTNKSDIIVLIDNNDILLNMGSDEWSIMFLEISEKVSAIKKQELIEQEEYKAFLQHELAEKQKQEDLQNKLLEAEKLSSLNDKDLFNIYIKNLKSVTIPTLKTKKWQGYLNTLIKTLDTVSGLD